MKRKYPILVQIRWSSTFETILIENRQSPLASTEFTTTEVWEDPPKQVHYVTDVISHHINGTIHTIVLDYLPSKNTEIAEFTDCFGRATITFDTSDKGKCNAEWANNPPSAEYDGKANSVRLVPAGSQEFLGFVTSIRRKRRQSLFKRQLLRIEQCCALTGETEKSALEAAHIVEVKFDGSHDEHNGILLRSDLHQLFDKGLLKIDPKTGHALLSESIAHDSMYRDHQWSLNSSTLARVHKALLKRAKIGS